MLVSGELAIGIMTVNGISDIHIVHGSADGDTLLRNVCFRLMEKTPKKPQLFNPSHCASHRVNWGYGALFATLLNPIEWCFSKVISFLEQIMELSANIELIQYIIIIIIEI